MSTPLGLGHTRTERSRADLDGASNGAGIPDGGTTSIFGTTVYTPDTSTVAQSTERGGTVWKVKTTMALTKARAQFGCQSLDGVELENQGGVGTAGED